MWSRLESMGCSGVVSGSALELGANKIMFDTQVSISGTLRIEVTRWGGPHVIYM